MSKRSNFFSGSSNPVFKEGVFERASHDTLDGSFIERRGERMTVQGAINKSFLLGLIMLTTAVVGFSYANPILMWGGAILGFIAVIVMSFKPQWSPTLAPVYAALEGLFVGSISAVYASFFSGIILQAVMLTSAVFFMMLFVFKTGIIKVTQKFRAGVFMATAAIALVYLLSIGLSFFGINIPYLHEGGVIGIGISLVIIGVAALNLLLDFDNFEKGAQHGAPAYMEWFSAMGLLVTLVWLYLEILRLLSILSRD